MTDREKVVSGLRHCLFDHAALDILDVTNHCNGCPYYTSSECERDLYYDALELLKAQEARVLTKDEIIGWNGYVYGEYRQGVMDVALIVMGIENNRHKGTWATKKLNWDEYGKSWRYWSAMPTYEQRKVVKWDAM